MTKILNIDSLKKEERIITLKGVSYPMKEMSVGDFIKFNEMAELADAKENPTSSDRTIFLVDSIAISFPTCPKEVLFECSFEEINAIADFARDGSLPDNAEIVDESGEPKNEVKAI